MISRITAAATIVTLSRRSRHQTSCQYDIGLPDGPSSSSCLGLGCSSTVGFTSISKYRNHRCTQLYIDHLCPSMVAIRGRSLGSSNARVDEALHDIDQKVEHDEK